MPAALADKPRLSLKKKSLAELYPGINFSSHFHSAKRPPTRKIPAWLTNLIGRRSGRLKVVGYLSGERKAKQARWVVRCSCGDYELRTARSILNPDNKNDKCQVCHHKGQDRHRQIVSRSKAEG